MKYEDLQLQLIAKRGELAERLERIKRDVTRKASPDWSEQAQERENDEVVDALGNEATAELNRINRALARIESGNFGSCSSCGNKIPDGRLEAMPYADLCISCAEIRS
ncbi:MAG: TraR/DksA family transcriptional regulator [Candidatus Endonucleobacter sp. (ex Gigantidas childressi)]|nr:TraR/DksA family transcriptional regulator [Candidatus Endonucleobacter sp. (ex Gigantidas childressi)]